MEFFGGHRCPYQQIAIILVATVKRMTVRCKERVIVDSIRPKNKKTKKGTTKKNRTHKKTEHTKENKTISEPKVSHLKQNFSWHRYHILTHRSIRNVALILCKSSDMSVGQNKAPTINADDTNNTLSIVVVVLVGCIFFCFFCFRSVLLWFFFHFVGVMSHP